MTPKLTVIALCCALCILSSTSRAAKMATFTDFVHGIFDTATDYVSIEPESTESKSLILQAIPKTSSGGGKVCGLNKECVRRFLCREDGSINNDGKGLIDIRIRFGVNDPKKENVCEYLEVCCALPDKLTGPKVPTVPSDQNEGCGYRNSDGVGFRIIGDEDSETQFGEFPWMVAILREDKIAGEVVKIYRCGGSVIAPNVVLTASHCVRTLKADVLVARAGEWDLLTTQELVPHQDARVKEIITHEHYNSGTLYNDVALLILQTPFNWEGNVRPVCLPPLNANFDDIRCFATGWDDANTNNAGAQQKIMRKVDLPVVPHDTCQANLRKTRLGHHFELQESFLCAGGEKDKDTCKGDGGSPLVCPDPYNPKRYYQAGIVAWGVGCGEVNVPGVYADVAHLRSWIDDKLSARGIDFSHFTT